MKSVIENKEEFEALDPILQAEYKEANGLFVLNADGIREHPEVMNLSSALEAVKIKKTDAATRLAELEAKAAEEAKALEEKNLLEQKKYNELAELKNKEAADAAKALADLQAEVLNSKIDSQASKIATAINSTDAKRQKFLAGEVRKYVQNTDNGLALLNPDGTPTDEQTVIASLKTEYPFLADGNPASGGGAPGNPGHQEHKSEPKTSLEATAQAFSGKIG